jgi:hypothetical protein
MKTEQNGEYQVSPRVMLKPGDRFRVSGGPYWKTGSGEKLPMATRGVCRFVSCLRRGKLEFLIATSGEGTVVLHVAGRRRNAMMPEMVCRRYVIRSRVKEGTARRRPRSGKRVEISNGPS